MWGRVTAGVTIVTHQILLWIILQTVLRKDLRAMRVKS